MKNKFNIKYQVQSFGWASKGLIIFFRQETKALVHTCAAIVVILTAFFLKLSISHWLWIISAIAVVFLVEIINTCIEELANTLTDKDDLIRGKVKDIAAGAVLFASLYATVIGLIIFLPKIISLWQNLN